MPRKSVALHGILAAVTTPFTADASAVDEAALTAQAEWLIGSGIHGLVPCGTTGEFPTLTPDEHRRVIELYVTAAAGRVPVIAGVARCPRLERSPWRRTPSASARMRSWWCRRSTTRSTSPP